MGRARVRIGLTVALLVAGAAATHALAAAGPLDQVADVPVLAREVPRGAGTTLAEAPAALPARAADGVLSDWIGVATRIGGTTVLSRGELVHQDYLFDAYGADDGKDAERLATLDPLAAAVPETYRLDAAQQADVPGQLGVPTPEAIKASPNYGDLPHVDIADLSEVRIAADASSLWLAARTTTMRAKTDTGLLVLLDTAAGDAERAVGFGTGVRSNRADVALLLSDGRAILRDLASGAQSELDGAAVAAGPGGWINSIEARLPLTALGIGASAKPALVVASGALKAGGDALEAVANVAFRHGEPVREWSDKRQALSLLAGSADPFFAEVPLARLQAGESERWSPGPGYHERIFVSTESVAREEGRNGILQHYGLYLPNAFDGVKELPLQLWLHWRGGEGHTAATLSPRIFKHLGEDRDAIVVSPRGRGSSTWYVGRGQVDIEDVWADLKALTFDRDRVYLTGHSMGGWGSYLLGLLHPDRYAAAAPFAGPVTQGAWTGLDFEGCEEYQFEEYTPCYIDANGSDPRAQHTRRLLENVRHVPYALFHGLLDELVPVSGVARQVEQFVKLGQRHRFYVFPAHEHYTHPIFDQWAEAARYMDTFRRDPNPAAVTYIRDMPFERAVERVQSDGVTLDFDFDRAYWMSGLQPVDPAGGVARFEGRSLAIAETPHRAVPEAGGPASIGQWGPYVMTGLAWLDDPLATPSPTSNGFEATLTGTRAVTLDLGRMAIDDSKPVTGKVTSPGPLTLRLDGGWAGTPVVTVDGTPAAAVLDGGVLEVELPAGEHALVVG